MNIKLYKLGGRVLLNYRKYVKGNETASKPLVRRKLTRNIMMAFKLSDNVDGRNTELYVYGNLYIYVRGDKITRIKNMFGRDSNWFYKDMKRYEELNTLLEIDKFTNIENMTQSA